MNDGHKQKLKHRKPAGASLRVDRTNSRKRLIAFCVCAIAAVIVAAVWTEANKGRKSNGAIARHRGIVTFNQDIAPIVFKNCSPCHRPSQPGPFNLLTYADVKKRANEIAKVTVDRTMPPWLAEPGYGEFKEERRLSQQEIRLIQSWLDTGAAEGRASDLPPLPQWSE